MGLLDTEPTTTSAAATTTDIVHVNDVFQPLEDSRRQGRQVVVEGEVPNVSSGTSKSII